MIVFLSAVATYVLENEFTGYTTNIVIVSATFGLIGLAAGFLSKRNLLLVSAVFIGIFVGSIFAA